MAKKKPQKGKAKAPAKAAPPQPPKDFLDMVAPTAVRFNTNSFILGGAYHCTLALRGYPSTTEELALLRHLGERSGVNLHIYTRQVSAAEEDAILHNATNKNRMESSNTNNMKQSITAEANLQDVATLIATMRREQEPLIHCAVFIELTARDADSLRSLREEVEAELTRSKLNADPIFLRQREGFLSSNPAGRNVFGSLFERVLPASSVANLYPFNYSGKNDPHGFYIGRDRFGSNIIVDLDRRADDKTTSSILILGNSGQGKSYLLKLLLCNILESGKSVICLDPEHELVDLCTRLGGCFVDLMSGEYIINVLEPKLWDVEGEDDPDAPPAFRKRTRLSQHISFLKDFFRAYKDFSDRHIDIIELMLERLYAKWGMDDNTNFSSMAPARFPILSDLYRVIEEAYENYGEEENPLYPAELLQEVLLGLRSICRGAESRFFNGHTNITSHRFLVFGVKSLLQTGKNVKNAMLFNVLSFISDKLLTAEDPVEYEIEGLIQVPINDAVGMTFHRALRAFLRQDPDRILVGEIRDFETAQTAIEASLTGHFVFSTLHTNDAASTVTRLVDMGVEPFLICSSLVGVLGQRLIRRVCRNCRSSYVPTDEDLARLGITREMVGDRKFYIGKGCPTCNHTGYKGRKALTELLVVDNEIRELINNGAPSSVLRDKAREMGMRTLREDGILAVLNGESTIDEVVRYT